MNLCSSTIRRSVLAAVLLGLLHGAAAMAQEGKIYKHVDEKGNVVYSQTPPMTGIIVKKLNMQPAYSGLGGYSIPVWPYDDAHSYYEFYRRDQYLNALQHRQQRTEDARSKRFSELEAECNRNRGTECSEPETLRYLESTRIPLLYRR